MNVAIILAGGVGSRMGGETPKQFISMQGKPIIAYTLEKFEKNENIDAIEIVCISSHMDDIKGIVATYGVTKAQWYAEGGDTFQQSTINGIFHLKNKLSSDDIVLLHSAVSPMVSDEIINDAIRVCKLYGNAIAADEMIMCTCIKDNEFSSSTSILRETLVGMNAPRAFTFGELCEAYETAIERGILEDLEPHTTSLYFALGKKIYFSKSSTNNIKITRKEDLELFEGYLLLQEKRKKESRPKDNYKEVL